MEPVNAGVGGDLFAMVSDPASHRLYGLVSLIQSNYWEPGSGLVPDGPGFMLQDGGALFALEDGHPTMTNGGTLLVESGVAPEVVEDLRRRGHDVRVTTGLDRAYGGYQAILWDAANGGYHAASEMRKDGQAAGY